MPGRVSITALLFFVVLSPRAATGDSDSPGTPSGQSGALKRRGIALEAVAKSDLLYNARGGIERDGTALGNFDLTLELDTQAAGLWSGGRLRLYGLGNWNHGGFISQIAGDLQVTSNIEATEAIRLYEAWYEHRLADDRLSVLVGLHDLNSEFDAIEYGAMFLNSSFGISADIAQTSPSIFPTTALAVRLRAEPSECSYALAAVYDGVPGDPDHSSRTTIRFDDGDGVFAVLEAGLARGEPGRRDYLKLGAGTWLHTARVERFDGEINDRNFGVYLIGEKTILAEADEAQGLGAFVQLGYADEDRNRLAYYWGAGVRYVGLIPGRDRDEAGVAVASAWNGDDFARHARIVEAVPVERTESVIEVAYRAEIFPGLILQPDLQYVINPSMDPELKNALQVGIRVEMAF